MTTQDSTSILIVEDDETLLQTLAYNLQREDYTVITAADGPSGLELARSEEPDLILLDIMLPELDGLTMCRTLRRELDVPIIIISARAEEIDKIVGLDTGADDYLPKPFGVGELLARIRAVMRRRPQGVVGYLEEGDLSLDLVARKAKKGQKELNLSYKEFDLLAELMRNKGVVLSRDLLLTKIWGYDRGDGSRTVDVHIRWLRAKIEDAPSKPTRIITIPRVGYRFEG
jgi:DNA-binding response OmpR family regulator